MGSVFLKIFLDESIPQSVSRNTVLENIEAQSFKHQLYADDSKDTTSSDLSPDL